MTIAIHKLISTPSQTSYHYSPPTGGLPSVLFPLIARSTRDDDAPAEPIYISKAKLAEMAKKLQPPEWWYGQKEEDLF